MKEHKIDWLSFGMDGKVYALKKYRHVSDRSVCEKCCFFKDVKGIGSHCGCPNSTAFYICTELGMNCDVVFKELTDFDAMFAEAESHQKYWDEQKRILKGEAKEIAKDKKRKGSAK